MKRADWPYYNNAKATLTIRGGGIYTQSSGACTMTILAGTTSNIKRTADVIFIANANAIASGLNVTVQLSNSEKFSYHGDSTLTTVTFTPGQAGWIVYNGSTWIVMIGA